MAIKSFLVRKKSQTLPWPRSTSSTKKATEHRRAFNLSGMAVEAVMAVEAAEAIMAVEAVMAVVVVGDALRMSVAEVAAMDAGATAVTAAIMDAEAAVASALGWAAAAAAAAAVITITEATGAGLTACRPGALMVMAISPTRGSSTY
jgi:hypothetical protein